MYWHITDDHPFFHSLYFSESRLSLSILSIQLSAVLNSVVHKEDDRKWWTLYNLVKTAEARNTILLQERKNLAIFLTLLWVLHFILFGFWWEGKQSTETFCKKFFYVLLVFFLFIFSWREEWYHMLQKMSNCGLCLGFFGY